MSPGDFAADLDQSVRASIDAIQTAAAEAKARIGTTIAASAGVKLREVSPFEPSPRRGAAVAFDEEIAPFDEPALASASDDLLDEPIFLDPPVGSTATDDEGIPVWEDSF